MAGNLIISSLVLAILAFAGTVESIRGAVATAGQDAAAEPGGPDGWEFAGCGIVQRGPQSCFVFEADDGQAFFLRNIGGFRIGDRVYVTGQVNPESQTCFPVVGPAIENNTICACFSGCGTLERGPQSCIVIFVADSGRAFALDNLSGFWWGDRVHVTGPVNEESQACSPVVMPAIEDNTIGTCFDGCGVLARGPQNCTMIFVADAGRAYALDNLGDFRWGDHVRVTGAINEESLACWPVTMPAIEHNLIRPCRSWTGTQGTASRSTGTAREKRTATAAD